MAFVVNFQKRIQDLTGALITAADDALEQFVIDGCYDVIDKLKKTDSYNAMDFSTLSTITTDVLTDVDNMRWVEYVSRNELPCRRVSHRLAPFVANTDSLHYATSDDPVYYILNNQLAIKPAIVSGEPGKIYYIPEYVVTNFQSDEGISSIDNFPNEYYEHVLLYASVMTLGRKLLDLVDDTSANSLSLDVIRKLFNEDLPADGQELFELLKEEDDEMIGSTIGVVQAAMSEADQKYKWYTERMMALRSEYMMKFNIGGQK